LPTGSVTIAAGQTTGSFQVAPPSIGTDVSDEMRVVITGITTADGSTAPATIAPTADFQIVNHAAIEGTDAQPGFVEFSGGGTLTRVGNAWTLNLGNIAQGGNAAQLNLGVDNLGPAGANLLSGFYALSGDHFNIENQADPVAVAGGKAAGGLQLLPDTSTLG